MSTTVRRSERRWRAEDVDRMLPAWLSRLLVVVLLLIVAVPVVYMLALSITPNARAALGEISMGDFGLSNYTDMWSQAPLFDGLTHTLIISGTAAAVSVLLGFLAAYPLTRLRFRGRRPFLDLLIATQTVPGTTLLLPFFVVLSWLQTMLGIQLIGGYFAIILTYMTFGLPLSTWLLVSYMATMPRDIEEAAMVDGCTRTGALFRVVLPLAVPAVAVAFVFAFLVGWNDVLFASVLTRPNTVTLAVAMEQFGNDQSGSGVPLYGELMAAGVVSALPVVVLYLLLQRRLVDGLSSGSLTGV